MFALGDKRGKKGDDSDRMAAAVPNVIFSGVNIKD